MFTGIEYYGTVYGNRPYKREMGETPEDMARAVRYQEAQEAAAQRNSYRPREMGETPEDVPSRAQQAEYSRRADANTGYGVPNSYERGSYSTRPREMGERPEDVARGPQRPRRYDEMTEQERRLDMYA